jgi:hypothetical protein
MMVGQTSGGALMVAGVPGILLSLVPLAIGVLFIWVALRVVDELTEIRSMIGVILGLFLAFLPLLVLLDRVHHFLFRRSWIPRPQTQRF